ncbi:phage tail protein [Pacificimonas sp. WHA3]|uniref:Phage tail protein n=1 Tax=Pacificimonas pallii TaxID=2827236 RepID=A0ABS6SA61_9SPHN|nr:phage tail protein [Pacificimonas pallii]MBV7255205.1 phage tail protein [Pacificimonas pallii]
MGAEKGSAFLLRLSDGGDPISFETVAGLRTTQMSIATDAVVTTNKGSGGWREILSEAGTRAISVSGAGVFNGSAAEGRLKAHALGGMVADYQLSFESGETVTGPFLVTRLDYAGDFGGERTYTLSLESAGPVVAA